MPLYEYICLDCRTRFDALRSMKDADEIIACKNCQGENTSRLLSVFFAHSDGRAIAQSAPACGTCASHACSTCGSNGDVIVERTHDFGSRLWVRIFGIIYSHPQPKSGNTTIVKTIDGLSLPTSFTGGIASEYLIDKTDQEERLDSMKKVCNTCHSTALINGHFSKFEQTIKETDEMTLAATKLMISAWEKKIEDKSNPFDEAIEQMWASQWLFYAKSVRYASAMTGAPDYASFKNGWWYLNKNLHHMKDWIEFKKKTQGVITE